MDNPVTSIATIPPKTPPTTTTENRICTDFTSYCLTLIVRLHNKVCKSTFFIILYAKLTGLIIITYVKITGFIITDVKGTWFIITYVKVTCFIITYVKVTGFIIITYVKITGFISSDTNTIESK